MAVIPVTRLALRATPGMFYGYFDEDAVDLDPPGPSKTYTGDISFFFDLLDGTSGAILVEDNDLSRDAGLETAVTVSLFTDKRANLEDSLPDGTGDLRGWWGDTDQNNLIGSHLWLLSRSKVENSTLSQAEGYVREALKWMIDDGVAEQIDVTAVRLDTYAIGFEVKITKPKSPKNAVFKYSFNWDTQSQRLGL